MRGIKIVTINKFKKKKIIIYTQKYLLKYFSWKFEIKLVVVVKNNHNVYLTYTKKLEPFVSKQYKYFL